MAEKVSINKKYEKLLKWAAFAPSLLLLPEFVVDPVEYRIVFLALLIEYWFLIFMIPHSFIRYYIKRYNFRQVAVDICLLWSIVGMWGISLFLWFKLFTAGKFAEWTVDESFPAGLFVIPFIALVYVAGVMEGIVLLWRVFLWLKSRIFAKKEKET